MRTWKVLTLGLALLIQSLAYAGNEHEHLQYLPSYEEIFKASGGKLGSYPAKNVISNPVMMVQALGEESFSRLLPPKVALRVQGKMNIQGITQALGSWPDQYTFAQACEKMSLVSSGRLKPEQIMKSFFSSDSLEGYITSGQVRNTLFEKRPALLVQAIEEHLKTSPLSVFNKNAFSVPKFLVNRSVLGRLKNIYESRGAQVKFYYSLPRNILAKPSFDFQGTLAGMSEGIQEGWLHGIDISGSIREGVAPDPAGKSAIFGERFEQLFKFSHDKKIAVRIHAYEGTRTGAFYDGFWKSFNECAVKNCAPHQLRIGHIQALGEEDIDRLSQLTKSRSIVFEANIESNVKLQSGTETQKLAKTIEKIHAENMRVVIGADGLGILGESANFENTLLRLKTAGLSEKSLERLLRDAHLPISGTRISKAQVLEWQRERTEVRNRVLGSEVKSIYRGPCRIDQALERLVRAR